MQRLAVTSSGLYNLSVGKVRSIVVPIPPLGAQRRILHDVDRLLSICSRLEAVLSRTTTNSSRLLEAVLHKALEEAGADTREPVAH